MDDSTSVYQSLFHSAPTAILVTEKSSHLVLEANPRFYELFGYSANDLKSMQLSDLIFDSTFRVDLNSRQLAEVYKKDKKKGLSHYKEELPKDFVSYAKNKSGENFLARFKCVNVGDRPDLSLIYINRADGFIQSLHWRSIVENLPSMAVLLNEKSEIIYANHVPEPYDVQKVVGTAALDYLPEMARENFMEKLRGVFESGNAVSFESEGYALEQVRIFRFNISPIRDDQSKHIDFALMIAQDVTDIVSNLKEKQEVDSAFSKLQHIAHIGSWSLDAKNNQVRWSDEMFKIFGVDRQHFSGNYWDVIYACTHPADRVQLDQVIAKIQRQSAESWAWEQRIYRQNDGKLRYLWVDGEYIVDGSGEFQKTIGYVQDITDYKLMQLGLSAVASCHAEGGGMALINQLLSCYLQSTGLDIIYIATISPDQQRLQTQVVFDRGKRLENFAYSIKDTPCERLIAKSFYSASGDIQSRFPSDDLLQEMGIKSYLGTALRDINNNVFAILVALHREKLEYPEIDKTLLQITATRVAAEMSRMQTQMELENSELHFRNAITSAEIVTWEWDLASNTLTWSDNVESLLALIPADFAAYQKLVHREDIDYVLYCIDKSLRQGRPIEIEHRIVTPDGVEKWVKMKGRHLKTVADKVNKFMGVISDITSEKNAVIEKRKIHSRLDMHIQQTPLGVIEMDRDCNIVEWNPAAEKIFGYKKEEALGKFIIDLIVPHLVKPSVSTIWNSLIENTGGGRVIHENITKSGNIINCDWHNTPLVNEKGQVIGVACIVEDVTKRIMIEQELKSHREHLEDLVDVRTREMTRINRELQAFSYSVSHDLRAPLRAIDGFSQILMEDYGANLDDTARSYLSRVRKGAQNMAMLIDDLLKLSRISRGQVNKQSIDLSSLAREVVDKLSQDYPHRVVETRIEDNLVAYADSGLIKVALENLLGNAWKYSGIQPAALVEFKLLRQDDKEAVYVISDNGVGFDMKFVDKLFGAFQRLHEKDKQFEGSGIGLATVQRIIRLHGGRVWAEGKVNLGAKFYFSLPLQINDSESVLSKTQPIKQYREVDKVN